MADSRLWASLPLEESTRATPPGWRPGIAGYSFKKYQDKLNLWWRTRSVESDETAARLVMQRLQKGALKRAMQFKLIREGREYIVGIMPSHYQKLWQMNKQALRPVRRALPPS